MTSADGSPGGGRPRSTCIRSAAYCDKPPRVRMGWWPDVVMSNITSISHSEKASPVVSPARQGAAEHLTEALKSHHQPPDSSLWKEYATHSPLAKRAHGLPLERIWAAPALPRVKTTGFVSSGTRTYGRPRKRPCHMQAYPGAWFESWQPVPWKRNVVPNKKSCFPNYDQSVSAKKFS